MSDEKKRVSESKPAQPAPTVPEGPPSWSYHERIAWRLGYGEALRVLRPVPTGEATNAAGQAMAGHQEGAPVSPVDAQLPAPAAPQSDTPRADALSKLLDYGDWRMWQREYRKLERRLLECAPGEEIMEIAHHYADNLIPNYYAPNVRMLAREILRLDALARGK